MVRLFLVSQEKKKPKFQNSWEFLSITLFSSSLFVTDHDKDAILQVLPTTMAFQSVFV